ncbi:SRPBCC family protein [Compostibacter hankyongensis]|uniref:SRPBCC family protein n=1 Tax=Compostibacter hankyongensis TaxID=1007089 RepID=A0ABP8FC06_9BACT
MSNEKSSTADRELRISRLLNAPVALVWEVFTDPDHIRNWWGPDGFTNTIFNMEVRPGGEWHFIMHGPDGTDYENKNVFKEVVLHQRIVFEHVSYPRHITTVTFESQDDKTMMHWHMLFDNREEFIEVIRTHGAKEGLSQNVAKLDVYLTHLAEKS